MLGTVPSTTQVALLFRWASLSPNLLAFVCTFPSKSSSVYTVLFTQLKFSSLNTGISYWQNRSSMAFVSRPRWVSLRQVIRRAEYVCSPCAGMGLTFLEPQNCCQEDIKQYQIVESTVPRGRASPSQLPAQPCPHHLLCDFAYII